jgi:integrase
VVGTDHLAQLVRDLRNRGYAASTVIRVLRDVKQAWAWAHARGYVARVLDVRVHTRGLSALEKRNPKAAGVRDKYTPPIKDAQAVARWLLVNRPNHWSALAYCLLLASGCRCSALAHVRWIDLTPGDSTEPGSIYLPKTKTGPRTTYVPAAAITQLRARRPVGVDERSPVLQCRARSGWRPLRPATTCGVGSYITSACAALKIQRFTPHALRRLAAQQFARNVLHAGGSLAAVAAQLGHTKKTMLQYYEQARDGEQQKSAAALQYAVIDTGSDADVIPIRAAT